jgi:integrase
VSVVKRGRSWSIVIPTQDPETGKTRQKWVVARDEDGKPVTSKRAAEKAERQALHRMDNHQDPFPEAIEVVAFYRKWLEHLDRQDKPRPRTRHEYARLVRTRILPAIGTLELIRVKPAHLQHLIDDCAAEGVKPGQLRAVLSTSFECALQWGLIAVNPARATTAPSRPRPKLTVPSAEQLRELVEAARTPWEVPVLISATAGTRREETLGLRWADVDLDGGTIRVERGLQRIGGQLVFTEPKTERSKRTIPLPGWLVERLRAHKTDQARRRLALGTWRDLDLVCEAGDGSPLDPDAFSKAAKRFATSIGLPAMRLHDVRHGVATMLAKSGARPEVTSALMGHSSVSFTQSVYTHPDHEQLAAAMRSVEEAWR